MSPSEVKSSLFLQRFRGRKVTCADFNCEEVVRVFPRVLPRISHAPDVKNPNSRSKITDIHSADFLRYFLAAVIKIAELHSTLTLSGDWCQKRWNRCCISKRRDERAAGISNFESFLSAISQSIFLHNAGLTHLYLTSQRPGQLVAKELGHGHSATMSETKVLFSLRRPATRIPVAGAPAWT